MKLDLACGNNKKEGFFGIDIVQEGTQADLKFDLDIYPYPFETESVDEIYCSHFIEHIDNLLKFMEEIHRILKMGGIVEFIAPYYTSVRASQDSTHKRLISEETFKYFNKKVREENKLSHYPLKCNFEIQNIKYIVNDEFENIPEPDFLWAKNHLWNVVLDIIVVLKKC